jgi:hypothetical protein
MVSRMREMWPGATDDQNELLNLVSRGRIPSLVSLVAQSLIKQSLISIMFFKKLTVTRR